MIGKNPQHFAIAMVCTNSEHDVTQRTDIQRDVRARNAAGVAPVAIAMHPDWLCPGSQIR
jgi:hypothetical protein